MSANRPPKPQSAPEDFSTAISTARAKSEARIEAKRRRERKAAEQHRIRFDKGVSKLDQSIRPLLEQALQACVEDGIPAILEDNYGERAVRPRLTFYCQAPDFERDGQKIVGAASSKMIVESDGDQVIFGTARSFSTSPENMKQRDDLEDAVSESFAVVLETFFDKHQNQF